MPLGSKDPSVNIPGIAGNKFLNNRQTMFLGYMLCVLVDLVVLNLFVEFWDKVIIDSFLLSLLTAALLQLLLKVGYPFITDLLINLGRIRFLYL